MGNYEVDVHEFIRELLIECKTFEITSASGNHVITLEDGSEWIFKM